MTVIETYEKNGWTCTLMLDDSPSNPRDDESHFLFLGLSHRRYNIGDEQVDHNMDCPLCGGCGHGATQQDRDSEATCPLCEGCQSADSIAMLEAFIKHIHKPLHIRRVGMGDHSNVWYYLGGGASVFDPGGWDSGNAGWMLYLPKHKEMWGGDPTPEELDVQMAAELQEYTDWCNGAVYGYVLTDINGEEVDSCWGLIGDYGEEEAKRVLASYAGEPQPEELRSYRLTDRQRDLFLYMLDQYNAEGDMEAVVEAARNTLNGDR